MNLNNSKSKFWDGRYQSILTVVFIATLGMFYSNCSEFKPMGFDEFQENLFVDEFAFTGTSSSISIDGDGIKADIDISPSRITEGEEARFTSNISYGYNGSGNQSRMDFNCSEDLGRILSRSSLGVRCTSSSQGGCRSYSGTSERTISDIPAGRYSCTLSFTYGPEAGANQTRTLEFIVKKGKEVAPPPGDGGSKPPSQVCEGSELIQGNFERCDDDSCDGWAFHYGQISARVMAVVTQTGAANRNVSFDYNSGLKREDVNAHLGKMGCLGGNDAPGSLLTGFSIPKSLIDQKLREASVTPGAGKVSAINISFSTNGLAIGSVSNYVPSSPIDEPAPPVAPPPPPPPPVVNTCPVGFIAGHLDGCNQDRCSGWAFIQGKNSTRVELVAEQTGNIIRKVTIGSATTTNRDDVTKFLSDKGCFSTNVLAAYRISKSDIDAALLTVAAGTGDGSASSRITVKGYIRNGTQLIAMPEQHSYTPNDPKVLVPAPLPSDGGGGDVVINRTLETPAWTGSGGSTWHHRVTMSTYNYSTGKASFGISSSSYNPNLVPRDLTSISNISVSPSQSGQRFEVGRERREGGDGSTVYFVVTRARFIRTGGGWKIDFYHQTYSRPKSTPDAALIEGPLSPLHGSVEFR